LEQISLVQEIYLAGLFHNKEIYEFEKELKRKN